MQNCTCGGEAILEHDGSKYFVCCGECNIQTKATFVDSSDAEQAWNNRETETSEGKWQPLNIKNQYHE